MNKYFSKYKKQIKALVYKYLPAADRQDGMQEVHLALIHAKHPVANEEGYVHAIARNTLLSMIKSYKNGIVPEYESVPYGTEDPLDIIEKEYDDNELYRRLEQLPEDVADLLYKAYIEEVHYRELAKHYEVPEGTIASRLNKAKSLLRGTTDV